MAVRKTAGQTSDKRGSMQVPLSPYANKMINAWCDRTGGSKTRLVEVLLELFGNAPESMQQSILGVVPRDMVDTYVQHAVRFVEGYVRNAAGSDAVDGEQVAALDETLIPKQRNKPTPKKT